MANTVISINERFDMTMLINAAHAKLTVNILKDNELSFDIKHDGLGVYKVIVRNIGIPKAEKLRRVFKNSKIQII